MNKEFIPYEQALELKELGFDEPCFGWYASDKSLIKDYVIKMHLRAPIFSQAFKWFREKYDLEYSIAGRKSMGYSFIIGGIKIITGGLISKNSDIVYQTYEEAELACLKKLIELIKNVQNERGEGEKL